MPSLEEQERDYINVAVAQAQALSDGVSLRKVGAGGTGGKLTISKACALLELPCSHQVEVDMVIQGLGNAFTAYAAMKAPPVQQQKASFSSADIADKVTISDAAKAMLASSQPSTQDREIQHRLDAIKAKPGVERTDEDTAYLFKHDKRFVEIQEKMKASGLEGFDALTADEVDYMQKAGGFVNTMAELSPKEKALYDEMVSNGNHDAAHGLLLVALSRNGMTGQQVTLPGGRSFDPTNTEVTADNVRNLFRQMFVDSSGIIDRQFEALATYLQNRESSGQMANKA